MRAGIAIDGWKLSIFKKHLEGAGFTFEQVSGVTADTLMLMVDTVRTAELAAAIVAANTEARYSRPLRR